ncbi:uncharacterized protein LOC108668771 isoform X2 [Hyalella azteca]|uniref:Uncharacterized protein LOC108668771 isoform X2 n=1 Tax=Hyalella azteca TaxID=294128 RepID=A0A8B7ND40_HYAAZ|nr:uncharacterized protein LOC108668771 isoform X2 [Hyalella azteca]
MENNTLNDIGDTSSSNHVQTSKESTCGEFNEHSRHDSGVDCAGDEARLLQCNNSQNSISNSPLKNGDEGLAPTLDIFEVRIPEPRDTEQSKIEDLIVETKRNANGYSDFKTGEKVSSSAARITPESDSCFGQNFRFGQEQYENCPLVKAGMGAPDFVGDVCKYQHTVNNLDANSDPDASDQEIPTSSSFLLDKSSGSVHFKSSNGSCLRGGAKGGGSTSSGPHVQFETPTPSQDDLFDESTEFLRARVMRSGILPAGNEGSAYRTSSSGRRKKRQRHISGSSTTSVGSSASGTSEASELHRKAPDGGWGWVVVAASFFVHCIADGVTMSFGVLFIEFLDVFRESKSFTSWVGSLFMAIPLLAGPLASLLTDHFGCRKVTIVGSVIASVGFLLSAFSNSILVLLITLGLITGLGLAVCYVAAIVIVAFYFEKKRSLATGIAVAGSGIGTFIFAPFIQYLIENWGWRGSLIILAGVFLNMCVCGSLMRELPWIKKKASKRSNVENAYHRNGSSSHSSESLSDDEVLGDSRHSCPPINELRKILQSGDITEFLSPGNSPTKFTRSSSMLLFPTFLNRTQTLPLDFFPCLNSRANAFEVISQLYPHLLSSSLSEQMDILPPILSDTRLNVTNNSDVAHVPTERRDRVTTAFPPVNRAVSVPASSPAAPVFNSVTKSPPGAPQTSPARNKSRPRHADLPITSSRKGSLSPEKRTALHDAVDRRASIAVGATEDGRCRPPLATPVPQHNRNARQSMTFRGAMLHIDRYKARSSSCPDIYRTTRVTIDHSSEKKLRNLKDVLKDCTKLPYCSDPGYIIFSLSNFILYLFYDTVYMYLVDYAIENGLHQDRSASLISIIGILNCIGMVGMGYIGDKEWYPLMIIYNLSMVICGVAIIMMSLVTHFLTLAVLSAVFGFFISANYALTSVILVDLISLDCFTNAYGFLLLTQGLANLFGPPLVGLMRDYSDDYVLPFVVSGVFIILSGLMLFLIPLFKSSSDLKKSTATSLIDGSSSHLGSKIGDFASKETILTCKENSKPMFDDV